MDMYQNAYSSLQGISPEELAFLNQATSTLDENQKRSFFNIYASKRKNPQDIMIFALLGFFGFAGIHRFVLGQVGMGLLYFFTGGLCLIGTIVDLVNYRTLTNEYNYRMAGEAYNIVKMNMNFY